jgi:hypothetical protein
MIPAGVREEFPGLQEAGASDEDAVCAQIGKQFQGRILVASRCPRSMPVVVLTLPFAGAGGPVPPLLWLTCPHLSSRTGTLESTGAMLLIEQWLEADPAASAQFAADEDSFCEIQREVALATAGEEVADRLSSKGVAGGKMGAIKCLQAHLAYRLALGPAGIDDERAGGRGAVGRWCLERLEQEGGYWCERPPSACIP